MGSAVDLKILEQYEISDLVRAVIYLDKEGFKRYRAVEPLLSREEVEILNRLKRAIQNVGEVRDGVLRLARERRVEYLEDLAKRAMAEFKIKLDEKIWGKMMYYLRRDLLGYGVLDPLVRDPYIEDVHVDALPPCDKRGGIRISSFDLAEGGRRKPEAEAVEPCIGFDLKRLT